MKIMVGELTLINSPKIQNRNMIQNVVHVPICYCQCNRTSGPSNLGFVFLFSRKTFTGTFIFNQSHQVAGIIRYLPFISLYVQVPLKELLRSSKLKKKKKTTHEWFLKNMRLNRLFKTLK